MKILVQNRQLLHDFPLPPNNQQVMDETVKEILALKEMALDDIDLNETGLANGSIPLIKFSQSPNLS